MLNLKALQLCLLDYDYIPLYIYVHVYIPYDIQEYVLFMFFSYFNSLRFRFAAKHGVRHEGISWAKPPQFHEATMTGHVLKKKFMVI